MRAALFGPDPERLFKAEGLTMADLVKIQGAVEKASPREPVVQTYRDLDRRVTITRTTTFDASGQPVQVDDTLVPDETLAQQPQLRMDWAVWPYTNEPPSSVEKRPEPKRPPLKVAKTPGRAAPALGEEAV
jgi:hypothetical protein